jgi:hypothetical protein
MIAVLGIIVLDRIARHLLGLDSASGLAEETGLLVLWGGLACLFAETPAKVPHCDLSTAREIR